MKFSYDLIKRPGKKAKKKKRQPQQDSLRQIEWDPCPYLCLWPQQALH